MTGTTRYAIYYACEPDSELGRFGAHLLGYDAFSGKGLPFPDDIARAVPDWRELTLDPRKYGFHATLKAPLSLAQSKTEADLIAACDAFAAGPRKTPVIKPAVNALGDFIAVVPAERSVELERLAADCVSAFDCFRAPLTPEDRARRNPDRLTPRQRDYLDRWGYPYVMEEFRFHMTLTGRLVAERREALLAMLRQRFASLNLASLAIDRIALFRQADANSRFTVLRHYALAQASA
jgi:putative phosphonate metabolism protein